MGKTQFFIPAEIIKRKRNGNELTYDELSFFINSFTLEKIPDYQMSALLMAIFLKGMTKRETLHLTKIMLESGEAIDFSNLPFPKVDKHSTGGVGDKTSLILGPVVAACDVAVPMISGRGLGHTGGTLDKLESIPGFDTQLDIQKFKAAIAKNKIAFIGQTKNICPADKKIYSLRDVTATVESLPLICASIMSKKLAEGIDGLVLDVKFGNGAFMKSQKEAEILATGLMAIAKGYGKRVKTLLTNMNQPLGQFAGNSLEVAECLSIMKNEKLNIFAEETRTLSLALASKMLMVAIPKLKQMDANKKVEQALSSGKAYDKFIELCGIHGGNIEKLPTPKYRKDFYAKKPGYISKIETEKIGILGIKLGAGRSKISDVIEPTAGFEFHAKVGTRVTKGEPLVTLLGSNKGLLESVFEELSDVFILQSEKVPKQKLIAKEL